MFLFLISGLVFCVGFFSVLVVYRFQFVEFFILFLPFCHSPLYSLYIEYYYSVYMLILPLSIYYELRNYRHKTFKTLTASFEDT